MTLTYAEAPAIGTYEDFSKFMKRLRKLSQEKGSRVPVRFLGVGEYGHKSGRFHYHGLIWNAPQFSTEEWSTRLWPLGFSKVGSITPASIRYTARYTLKFAEKGLEAVASWSRQPPLGALAMQSVGEQLRRRGSIHHCPPKTLSFDGKTYPCDTAMQIAFAQGFNPDWVKRDANGTLALAKSSAVTAHADWILTMKLGDPVEQQRRRDFERAHFWETAKMVNDTL